MCVVGEGIHAVKRDPNVVAYLFLSTLGLAWMYYCYFDDRLTVWEYNELFRIVECPTPPSPIAAPRRPVSMLHHNITSLGAVEIAINISMAEYRR